MLKSTPRNTEATLRKASIKEAIGKLTGDVTIEAEGEFEKNRAEESSSKSDAKSGSTRRS